MKNLFYYFILISILFITSASSCDKPTPEEGLPTGENTCYYYIDGQLIIPEGFTSGVSFIEPISFGRCGLEYIINTLDFDNNTPRLSLFFKDGIQSTGAVYLTTSSSGFDMCQNDDNIGFLSRYESDGFNYYYTQNNSGQVSITYLSEDKRHFIGTFEITFYHENTGLEKHITDGHFNVNLDTLND